MNAHELRKQKIRESFQDLVNDGFLSKEEPEDASSCLDLLSAAELMVEYKLHVSGA